MLDRTSDLKTPSKRTILSAVLRKKNRDINAKQYSVVRCDL